MYDKADRSFNDHLENEKNPESRGKRDSPVRREKGQPRGTERERLRGKIRKRENLDGVLIANMTMLNSPPGDPPSSYYARIGPLAVAKLCVYRMK